MLSPANIDELRLELAALAARLPDEECQFIREFVERHEETAFEAYRWVFCESPAYVDARVWAASQLSDTDPQFARSCASSLLHSVDPDDRDTGITFLLTLTGAPFEDAALALLHDPYPYLQILGAEYALLHGKADEARAVIDELSHSPRAEIRERAKSFQARC